MQLPISIVIPVKNDAENLADCLPLLRDFDEVVIVDSNSSDSTSRVAAQWGRRVVRFDWDGKFPKKRNWALRNLKFKNPWVLFLDADERMTHAFLLEASAFCASRESAKYDVVICLYDNWFAGRLLRHGDPMRKTAMVRVGSAEYEKIDEDNWSSLDMEIHEHLQPKREGAAHQFEARLEHHDKRSLDSHWQKHVQYAEWESQRYRQIIKRSSDWGALTVRQRQKYRNITKWWLAPAYFVVCYFLKLGFLDGWAGLHFAWFKLRYFRMVRSKILMMGKADKIGGLLR